MADTQRSQSELQVLFADNESGAITPQALRDFLESCHPSHGALHFTDPGTPTTITQASTFVVAANTASLQLAHRYDQPASGRLRYTGRVVAHTLVHFAGSVTGAASNQVVRIALAINGIIQVPSYVRTKLGSAGDDQAIATHLLVDLNPNDYLEVWLANDTGANNITVEHGYLAAMGYLT